MMVVVSGHCSSVESGRRVFGDNIVNLFLILIFWYICINFPTIMTEWLANISRAILWFPIANWRSLTLGTVFVLSFWRKLLFGVSDDLYFEIIVQSSRNPRSVHCSGAGLISHCIRLLHREGSVVFVFVLVEEKDSLSGRVMNSSFKSCL